MRNHLLKSFTVAVVFGALLALAAPSSAQWRGGYNRTMVGRLISQAESHSNRFVAAFDRALDRSGMEGTIREERLNERARDLENALNMVRQTYEQGGSNFEIRSQLDNALNTAERINNVMRNRQLSFQAERQWTMLRSDLNRLAAMFNLRQLR